MGYSSDPTDKGLFLVPFFERLVRLDADMVIQVFYDPDTWLFYILYDATLPVLIPEGARLLAQGKPSAIYSAICRILSYAVTQKL